VAEDNIFKAVFEPIGIYKSVGFIFVNSFTRTLSEVIIILELL